MIDIQAFKVVLETLQRASSQNSEVLKPAEKQLTEWESQPGFYTVLLVSEYIYFCGLMHAATRDLSFVCSRRIQ